MACLLREDDVRRLLTMDEALKAVEGAFRTVAPAGFDGLLARL